MSFQHTISHSRAALPVCVCYGLSVWALLFLPRYDVWPQLLSWLVAVWLMAEINNRNTLLREYSRMVSCSFIALTCMAGGLFSDLEGCLLGTGAVLTVALLLATYQDRGSLGLSYTISLLIAAGSLRQVWLLALVPVVWALMAFCMQSLSFRGLFASVLGLLTPYWIALPYIIYTSAWPAAAAHFTDILLTPFPADYSALPTSQVACYLWTVLLGLIGTCHFLATRYSDKVRARLIYYTFITLFLFTAVAVALFPCFYCVLMRLLIITVSPLIAHFLALSNNRFTNILTKILIIATVAMTLIIR